MFDVNGALPGTSAQFRVGDRAVCSRRCVPLMLERRRACDFLTEAKRRTLLHAGTPHSKLLSGL
jgi:hypothetical protein